MPQPRSPGARSPGSSTPSSILPELIPPEVPAADEGSRTPNATPLDIVNHELRQQRFQINEMALCMHQLKSDARRLEGTLSEMTIALRQLQEMLDKMPLRFLQL